MAIRNHNPGGKKAIACAHTIALFNPSRYALRLIALGICLIISSISSQITWATENHRNLTIFYTNDVRGNIDPCGCGNGQLGDISTRAAVLGSLRAQENNVLIVDSGDAFSDESLFNTFDRARRDLIVEAMGYMGYDYLNIGDTELGFGLPVLKNIRDKARFKLLSANILDQTDRRPIFSPYALRQVGNLKVALIGLVTDHLLKRIPPDYLQGLILADPFVTAKAYVSTLRDQSDLVIVIAHLGREGEKELARVVPQIDIIIGGHSGRKLRSPLIIGKTLIMEGGDQGQYVGKLSMKLNEVNEVISYEHELIAVDALHFQANQHVRKLWQNYREKERRGDVYDRRDRRKRLIFSLEEGILKPKAKD
jgi:2',3'-cyclic-nucleotide 2'-phosphodiesterase (5'-nucleotidase family)